MTLCFLKMLCEYDKTFLTKTIEKCEGKGIQRLMMEFLLPNESKRSQVEPCKWNTNGGKLLWALWNGKQIEKN